jgi:hydroxysqualene synthase
LTSPEDDPALRAAFAHCERIARAHYENFPVGLFVPRASQKYVHALYAFARTADDFVDEPEYAAVRAEKLADWQQRLDATYAGRPDGPIFVALGATVRKLGIDKRLLDDLLSAFRQDTVKSRYADWEELRDYCRRSADPVGRLVLLVFGYRDPSLARSADALCTALQLANHWQDLGIDLARDRIYVPQQILARHGVDEAALRAHRADEPFRALMQDLVARTRELFTIARPLCDRVGRDLRFELRLTWLGGSGILDRIEAAGYDVFRRRPHHNLAAKLRLAWHAWRWRAA